MLYITGALRYQLQDMKYVSNALLDDLYNQVEAAIDKAITHWQQLPAHVMNKAPDIGKWSAAQCLEHLNSYGYYYLPAIKEAFTASKVPPDNEFKSGMLGNYFYKLMLTDSNGTIKKKMAAPKKHQPPADLDPASVLSEFISQLEKIGMLITAAKQKNIAKVKVSISIAPFIKLKAGDVLLFYVAHIRRHMHQAGRALKAANAVAVKSSVIW
jgi:DinB superfamily